MQNRLSNETLYKFTQKYIPDSYDPAQTTITNLYLTRAEYEALAILPAQVVEKKRTTYVVNGLQYSLDVFAGRHRGLVLAEIEFENEAEMEHFPLPVFAVRDVTGVPFLNGGSLAAVSQQAFEEGLAGFLSGNG